MQWCQEEGAYKQIQCMNQHHCQNLKKFRELSRTPLIPQYLKKDMRVKRTPEKQKCPQNPRTHRNMIFQKNLILYFSNNKCPNRNIPIPCVSRFPLRGRSQTTFANFANFWPPTYLCLHWLTFGLPPTYLSTLTCDNFLPYITLYW